MEKQLIEICGWKAQAVLNRALIGERPKYLRTSLHDCRNCNGKNTNCESYTPQSKFEVVEELR